MQYFLGSDIDTRVRTELDLIDEPGLTAAEMLAYINEAIDVAESEIHTLYEDYFLNYEDLNLVNGTSEYALPTSIFASKIRTIIYKNNNIIYEVKRITGKHVFERIQRSIYFNGQQDYEYILRNESASAGIKLLLVPASRETASSLLRVWYYRNANRLTTLADTVDIPEFSSFIVAYIKYLISINKPGFASPEASAAQMEAHRKLMVDTLSGRTPDENTEIYIDRQFYEEHS